MAFIFLAFIAFNRFVFDVISVFNRLLSLMPRLLLSLFLTQNVKHNPPGSNGAELEKKQRLCPVGVDVIVGTFLFSVSYFFVYIALCLLISKGIIEDRESVKAGAFGHFRTIIKAPIRDHRQVMFCAKRDSLDFVFIVSVYRCFPSIAVNSKVFSERSRRGW